VSGYHCSIGSIGQIQCKFIPLVDEYFIREFCQNCWVGIQPVGVIICSIKGSCNRVNRHRTVAWRVWLGKKGARGMGVHLNQHEHLI